MKFKTMLQNMSNSEMGRGAIYVDFALFTIEQFGLWRRKKKCRLQIMGRNGHKLRRLEILAKLQPRLGFWAPLSSHLDSLNPL